MKQLLYLLAFTIISLTTACESTIEKEILPATATIIENKLSGDWMVTAYMDNDITYGPFDINIQMTTNENTISINDQGQFWGFQAKVTTDLSNNTFESSSSLNEMSEVKAKIILMNGKLIGNDSISFDIQFEDDVTPYGLTYNLKGSRNS